MRVGRFNGSDIATDSIGEFSAALGYHARATEWGSFAIGEYARAAYASAVAIGYDADATDEAACALGYYAAANGYQSVAIGTHSQSIGNNSVAIGNHATADGYQSIAIGDHSMTDGNSAYSMGFWSKTFGDEGALSVGHYTIANGDRAMVAGQYNDPIVGAGTSVGDYSPLFIIGNGNSDADRKNALTIIKNGNIGFGINQPLQKLQLHQPSATQNNFMKFSHASVGATGSDGFDIGLSASKDAFIWMWENEEIYFGTNNNYRMTIAKNGNIGIGTGVSSPSYRLQVGIQGDGTQARANAWNTFSDRRWKTELRKISTTNKLEKINGYYFKWTEGSDQSEQIGFIAQEIEAQFPQIVSTDQAGYKSVDYSKMAPILLEAIKDQQKLIDDLQKKVEALEKIVN